MKVYRDIDRLPEFKNAVVTIGTFDGVHLGHQKIIDQLKKEAGRVNGETVIITFHPHPRKVVLPEYRQVQLITTIDERIELLRNKGVNNLVIVPFTRAFSDLEPANYIEEFLYEKFHPSTVIIGYDHRFGKERKGDYKLLEKYAALKLFNLKEIPQHLIQHNTVSSTLIRQSLTEGDMEKARNLLGYDFFFEGIVEKGDQLGRTIGYPTANLKMLNEDKIVPANGVYAVEIARKKFETKGEWPSIPHRLTGMMNIGIRPTINGKARRIEVNIFDFDENVYGETLRIYVKEFLRSEVKFSGLDSLKEQLAKDRENALEKLGAG